MGCQKDEDGNAGRNLPGRRILTHLARAIVYSHAYRVLWSSFLIARRIQDMYKTCYRIRIKQNRNLDNVSNTLQNNPFSLRNKLGCIFETTSQSLFNLCPIEFFARKLVVKGSTSPSHNSGRHFSCQLLRRIHAMTINFHLFPDRSIAKLCDSVRIRQFIAFHQNSASCRLNSTFRILK